MKAAIEGKHYAEVYDGIFLDDSALRMQIKKVTTILLMLNNATKNLFCPLSFLVILKGGLLVENVSY